MWLLFKSDLWTYSAETRNKKASMGIQGVKEDTGREGGIQLVK